MALHPQILNNTRDPVGVVFSQGQGVCMSLCMCAASFVYLCVECVFTPHQFVSFVLKGVHTMPIGRFRNVRRAVTPQSHS